MKSSVYFAFIFLTISVSAQSPIGAWEGDIKGANGEELRGVVILCEGYQAIAVYNPENGAFVNSNGGKWRLEGNTMTETVEFDTKTPERVGSEVTFDIAITDSTPAIVGSTMILKRIDDGTPGKLQGAWLMSGRIRDGETQMRNTSGPRKTMKLLSGTRFQWIAYNTETKEFMGTGGGTYTTEGGQYTENIVFFSRDNSRVGVSLSFDYELVDGNWYHKGLSSKGNPIHEIWSVRK